MSATLAPSTCSERGASDWVQRFSHLIPAGTPVLDLACGLGRHSLWFLRRQHPVLAIDRDPQALAAVKASWPGDALTVMQADLEQAPWPLKGQLFGAVVVTHYLWRPLIPHILSSLAEGGVLVYETFARGHETVGRPSRPEFLLMPGELLSLCAGLRVVAYEDGWLDGPSRFTQRIAAVRAARQPNQPPARYPLIAPPSPSSGTVAS